MPGRLSKRGGIEGRERLSRPEAVAVPYTL